MLVPSLGRNGRQRRMGQLRVRKAGIQECIPRFLRDSGGLEIHRRDINGFERAKILR